MKKALALFLSALTLFMFSGCNKKSSGVTAVTSGLKFTAEINISGKKHEYNVSISKDNNTSLELLNDGVPSGFNASFSGDNVTLSYNGLEYKRKLGELPEGLNLDFLHSVFSNAATLENAVFSQNNEFFISGETQKYNYRITVGQTGLPIKIEEQSLGITAIIKNASLL